jgi:hypothetical protein
MSRELQATFLHRPDRVLPIRDVDIDEIAICIFATLIERSGRQRICHCPGKQA